MSFQGRRTHDGYGFGWRSILLSRAGRLAVPGLTIVSRKRYWTGEGSDELIIDAVRSFRPVLLVLHDRQLKDPLWQQWLAEEYLQTYSSGEDLLYVRRDLNPVPELITIDQIRALGL